MFEFLPGLWHWPHDVQSLAVSGKDAILGLTESRLRVHMFGSAAKARAWVQGVVDKVNRAQDMGQVSNHYHQGPG